jgi:hypothetical protein
MPTDRIVSRTATWGRANNIAGARNNNTKTISFLPGLAIFFSLAFSDGIYSFILTDYTLTVKNISV